eukprot:5146094-Amphidinium_carterae.1
MPVPDSDHDLRLCQGCWMIASCQAGLQRLSSRRMPMSLSSLWMVRSSFGLRPSDRSEFQKAMEKEWNSWLQFQAVEILRKEDLPQPVQTIGTRWDGWVHVDKNERARKGGVVQGHQEKVWIRSDAPTASVLCFNLICHVAATRHWSLRFADASSAFLQTAGRLGRLLLLRLPTPPPPPPGVPPDCVLRARGSIYGTRDAPRAWWLHHKQVLTELGWTPNPLKQAFFVLLAKDGEVIGLLLTHVDDLLFTGRGSIMVVQSEATKALEPAALPKSASKQVNDPLTPEEVTELRRIIGSTLVAKAAKPTIGDLIQANALVGRMQEDPDFGLVFYAHFQLCCLDLRCPSRHASSHVDCKDDSSLGLHVYGEDEQPTGSVEPTPAQDRPSEHDQLCVFVASDAAFANVDQISSQAGFVVGIRVRAVRSTLGAEANALVEAAEYADYCRQ